MSVKATLKGDTRVVTGVVRLSFNNLFTPRLNPDTGKSKYDCCLLIDKDTDDGTIKVIETAIENAIVAGTASKWGGKRPKKLELPLHDGDDKEDSEFADSFEGKMYLNPKSNRQPGIVDRKGVRIIDAEELKSGDYILAALSFFPYEVNGKRGIGVGIDNVLKYKEGESLAGSPSAESDFAGVDLGSEEDDDEGIF